MENKCKVEWCDRKSQVKGLCKKHYYLLRNVGELRRTLFDPNEIVCGDDFATIHMYSSRSIKNSETIIDLEDVERCSKQKWYLGQRGYPTTKIKGKLVCLHKFLTGYKATDHIDRNPLNNRKSNLRECSQRQNIYNQSGNKNNVTSKYKGVYYNKKHEIWCVQCKRKYGGRFKKEKDAALAYNTLAKKLYGEYAYLNTIE